MERQWRVGPRGSRGALHCLAVVVVLGAGLVAGCDPPPPPPPLDPPVACTAPGTPDAVPVMGCSRLTAEQLVSWFLSRTRPEYRALVPVDELAAIFVHEGDDEGVRGDLAFVQSVVETGWFNFPDGGTVRPEYDNFAGIGAIGTPTATPAQFPDATTGVRAQIQHLRAYADATVTEATLHHPLVDPRFALVLPKGKAPLWNDFGNGTWAMSPTYATTVLTLYAKVLTFYGMALG